jgi:hypothetical protein
MGRLLFLFFGFAVGEWGKVEKIGRGKRAD